MIVSPRSLLRGYGWRDTLAHEYAHLVVSRVSHNAVPIWLHEGLAKVFEHRWRLPAGDRTLMAPVQKHLLAHALRNKKLVSWRSMHPSMAKLPDQRTATLAFAQVQTAVDFLIQRLGLDGLRKMLTLMREGEASVWKALEMVGGLTMDKFTADWRRYLAGLDLRTLPGYQPIPLALGKALTTEQRLAKVRQKKAKEYLRLANMLRSRRRTRAAIVEYQKARKLMGERDDLVANHLARAYLEVASPAQAIAALLPVLEYYPELPGPQVTMGIAYLRAGDTRAAARHLRAGLRINPFSPEIHCGLGEALTEINSTEAALHDKICKRLKKPGSPDASRDR
jgi:tetratricopeptide (TPR) repeat protein